MTAEWQFSHLQMFGYSLIVADPPWNFELYSEEGAMKSASAQYETMSIEDIMALRVGDLATRDCLLLLCSTGCMLPQCLGVMTAWGFTFKSEIVWRKTTRNGKVRMGPGYRVRTMHEPILIGTMGNPHHKAFPSIIDGLAREHSRKPDELFALAERQMPHATRVELFSRQSRAGWETWGRERQKFDGPAEPRPVAKRFKEPVTPSPMTLFQGAA